MGKNLYKKLVFANTKKLRLGIHSSPPPDSHLLHNAQTLTRLQTIFFSAQSENGGMRRISGTQKCQPQEGV
jgi:hypothetical protein